MARRMGESALCERGIGFGCPLPRASLRASCSSRCASLQQARARRPMVLQRRRGRDSSKWINIKQRIPTPCRVAPPLCDPVWQDGQLLYVDHAFDPKGLSECVLRVTSCSGIEAQHAYPKNLGKGVGPFNFGVVPHMGIPGMYLQTRNRNVLFSSVGREELRACL